MASEKVRETPEAEAVAEESGFAAAEARPRGRIEGGVDALVIGGSFDGLVAAALLGRAGLKTILLGADDRSTEAAPREFAPGYFCNDGEHLVYALDAETIQALDLYRHGLSFAARRLDTVYAFSDGGALLTDGDLYRTRESVAAMTPVDREIYAAFVEAALDAGRVLRPFFEGGAVAAPGAALAPLVDRFMSGSVEEAVDHSFASGHLRDLLAAEASFRSAARPTDPFGFLALIRRWAGEAAGLQAASAYPAGGSGGVARAARRAAQAARVDFRPATGVKSVLVEWDAVAGVETSEGGQIRAPVIINAQSAGRAFLDQIGAALLDLEFQSALKPPPARLASARVHFALSGAPDDDRTRVNLGRRLVFAPSRAELRRAFNAARSGEVASPLILEAIVPSSLEPGLAPAGSHVVSAIAHPVPAAPRGKDGEAKLLEAIAAAAAASLERVLPGSGARIVAVDVRPALLPAAQPVMAAWARARTLAAASGIGGYFFCGPEAQIGAGLDGSAARRAAQAAIRYAKAKAARA